MGFAQTIADNFKSLPRGQQTAAAISVAVILIATIWILVNLVPGGGRQRIGAPNTPEQRVVDRVNAELSQVQELSDVGATTDPENPARIVIRGAVYSPEDLRRLTEKLKELEPGQEFEIEVELLRK